VADATHLYSGIIKEASRRYGIPEGVLIRQMQAESGGNPQARSPVGALGLMQLMPATARGLGVENPFDPRENIMGGAKYLRDQINHFGSLRKALAAYNAGPAAVTKYGGVPPFAETRDYVSKILGGIPHVGAAPQESPPALAASAGMGVRAPTPTPQAPNFLSMARQLAAQGEQGLGTTATDAPLNASVPGDAVNGLEAPAVMDWRQFLPKQQKAPQPQGQQGNGLEAMASELGPMRAGAPRLGIDLGSAVHAPIIQAARGYLGVPYKWGGTSRQTGMDCSGFLQNVYKDVGVKIGRTTYEQVKEGHPVSLKNLQPGDAVFTEPGHAGPNHVGLYVGHGMIQESPHTGTVNSYIPLKDYLGGHFVAARRYTGMLPQPKERGKK
jgi:Transglycosylase SLT domain/NlpC/P60 family